MWGLATAYGRARRTPDKDRVCRRLLALHERSFGPDHSELIDSLCALAGTRTDLGYAGEGEALFLRALPIAEQAYGPNDVETTHVLKSLGMHFFARGRYADAAAFFERSRGILEVRYQEGSKSASWLTANISCLAMCYTADGRHADAEATLRRELELTEANEGDDLQIGAILAKIARACALQSQYEESDSLYRGALDRHEEWFSKTLRARRFHKPTAVITRHGLQAGRHLFRGDLQHGRAGVLRALSREDEAAELEARAERALKRHLRWLESRGGADDLGSDRTLHLLADVYRQRGKHAEALPLYLRVVAIHRAWADQQKSRLPGPDYAAARERIDELLAFRCAPALRDYSAALRALGRDEEADDLATDCRGAVPNRARE